MVEDDGAFAFESEALLLKVSQIDNVFEFGLQPFNDFGCPLLPATQVLHRVKYVDALGNVFARVASEPVGEHSVRGVVTRLGKEVNGDSRLLDVSNELFMLTLDASIELGVVGVKLGVHELVVEQRLGVAAELGRLDSEDLGGESSSGEGTHAENGKV